MPHISRKLKSGLKLAGVGGLLACVVAAPATPPVVPPPDSPGTAVRVYERDGSLVGSLGETVLWTTGIGLSGGTDRLTARTGSYVVTESLPDEGIEPSGNGRRVISARDALTGLPAWSIVSGYPDEGSFNPFYYVLGVAAQQVVVDVPSLRVIRGLAVATGRIAWETPLPDGCVSLKPTNQKTDTDTDAHGRENIWGTTDERTAGLLARCADARTTLLGFDVHTGGLRWRRAMHPAGKPAMRLEKGVFVLEGDESLALVGDDGLVLFDDAAMFAELAITDRAVVMRSGSVAEGELRSIDRLTGRILWRRPSPPRFEKIRDSAGRVVIGQYLDYPLTGQGVPGLETVIDPVTGRTLPAPTWVDRGIIDPNAWPDPCDLVTASDLASRSAGPYSVTATPAPAQFGLPTPDTCLIRFDSGISISIRLIWVSRREKDARATLDEIRDGIVEGEARGIADRAYFHNDDYRDGVLLCQGPVIASVRASGDAPLALWAAKTVARHLREMENR
ncbi:outer membrane protein assembly factor BamB family protein [Sphaerisporangium perillae]|uniref:outer membrane protein assembly factor BamB family protein n=1 Tax=Sphaerisporangium perillae TaxID=2935860 RepID=UPI00200D1B31|nr:PQQ-binding-like beta-propeller repeat protein [Sphaerisporangium perillae]